MTPTGRLDLVEVRTYPQPPSAVDASADARARFLVNTGHLLIYLAIVVGLVLIGMHTFSPVGQEPSGPTWLAAWLACIATFLVSLLLIVIADRYRKKTGYPVPAELYELVHGATEAVRQLRELFDMVDAATVEPQWTKEMNKAGDKQLRLIGRRCEHAARAQRWGLTWALPRHERYVAKLAVPLHETTANFAKGIFNANPEQNSDG